jgi:hypothetical protein
MKLMYFPRRNADQEPATEKLGRHLKTFCALNQHFFSVQRAAARGIGCATSSTSLLLVEASVIVKVSFSQKLRIVEARVS